MSSFNFVVKQNWRLVTCCHEDFDYRLWQEAIQVRDRYGKFVIFAFAFALGLFIKRISYGVSTMC